MIRTEKLIGVSFEIVCRCRKSLGHVGTLQPHAEEPSKIATCLAFLKRFQEFVEIHMRRLRHELVVLGHFTSKADDMIAESPGAATSAPAPGTALNGPQARWRVPEGIHPSCHDPGMSLKGPAQPGAPLALG